MFRFLLVDSNMVQYQLIQVNTQGREGRKKTRRQKKRRRKKTKQGWLPPSEAAAVTAVTAGVAAADHQSSSGSHCASARGGGEEEATQWSLPLLPEEKKKQLKKKKNSSSSYICRHWRRKTTIKKIAELRDLLIDLPLPLGLPFLQIDSFALSISQMKKNEGVDRPLQIELIYKKISYLKGVAYIILAMLKV